MPEFEYLKNNEWVWTEKVDGTNIRVMWNGNGKEINYGGKTDKAQTPFDLIKRLQEIFEPKIELFKETFGVDDDSEVCFYGEGYGAGIQKGGVYKPTKDFVLFDVKIGHWWLQRQDVEQLAEKFGVDIVPIVGEGTLQEAVDLVRTGVKSKWGDFTAEGLVLRPSVELKTRSGERIITKIKHRDFII